MGNTAAELAGRLARRPRPNARLQPHRAQPARPGGPAPAPPALAPVAAPRRALAHPRVLRLDAEVADLPLLRRYKVRGSVPDSLSALREVRELVRALQGDAYLTASAEDRKSVV